MQPPWPELPYESWHDTRDTLHGHTQLLGKLAAALAPPEPQLQHAALRLTARGWETPPLPVPDGSGALVAALDLRTHEARRRAQRRPRRRIPLHPDRSVGAVARDLLGAVRELAGPLELDLTPQETPWTTPLDEDEEHATLRRRARRGVLRGSDAGRARAGRAARALPRPLDARQRLVGVVRPRRQPLLGRARRASGR